MGINAQIIDIPDANFKAKLLEADSGVGIAYLLSGGVTGGSFKIDANDNGEIEVSEVLLVGKLYIKNSNISDLTGIEYFTNLETLRCEENLLTSLDVTALTNLRILGAYNNNLTSIDVAGLTALEALYCFNNELTSIDISTLSDLGAIQTENNNLTSIDFSNTPNLNFIRCQGNQIINLDVSNLVGLNFLNCSSNALETLNVKNGYSEFNLDFSNNDNLQFICADDFQIIDIEDQITAFGYIDCYTNSLCSYISGEDFYQISGQINYDEDENGCDIVDVEYPELMFSYSDGVNTATTFADENGFYTSSVQAGDYTFTLVLMNPTYFDISPSSKKISFPQDANSNIQDFCVSQSGAFPDLKVTMQFFDGGYDSLATYQINYENQGTITQSGNISVVYDDGMAILDSSIPMVDTQNSNDLIWNFADLKPFEKRTIDFTMDLSALLIDTGEANIDYTVNINAVETDTTPSDNTFIYDEPYYCCLLNTIEYTFNDYFVLYPNPVKDIVHLKIKKSIDIKSIEVYNIIGQKVNSLPQKNSDISIDVVGLNSGHYFIKIITSETTFTSRFIKTD